MSEARIELLTGAGKPPEDGADVRIVNDRTGEVWSGIIRAPTETVEHGEDDIVEREEGASWSDGVPYHGDIEECLEYVIANHGDGIYLLTRALAEIRRLRTHSPEEREVGRYYDASSAAAVLKGTPGRLRMRCDGEKYVVYDPDAGGEDG